MAAHPEDHKVVTIGSSEVDRILADLRALRQSILTAWQERAVILNQEEQLELAAAIKETCELLTDLTSHG